MNKLKQETRTWREAGGRGAFWEMWAVRRRLVRSHLDGREEPEKNREAGFCSCSNLKLNFKRSFLRIFHQSEAPVQDQL